MQNKSENAFLVFRFRFVSLRFRFRFVSLQQEWQMAIGLSVGGVVLLARTYVRTTNTNSKNAFSDFFRKFGAQRL